MSTIETLFGKRNKPTAFDTPIEPDPTGEVPEFRQARILPVFGKRETKPAGSKWDHRFMGIARDEVATWSKDPSTKVGCVLVSPDRRQIAMGYNGLPAGVRDTAERLGDKVLKNQLTVHAELNAILNARVDLTGWTLYVTKPPCVSCAAAIIQAGIKKVVCPPLEMHSSWFKSQAQAWDLLTEAGVKCLDILKEQ